MSWSCVVFQSYVGGLKLQVENWTVCTFYSTPLANENVPSFFLHFHPTSEFRVVLAHSGDVYKFVLMIGTFHRKIKVIPGHGQDNRCHNWKQK